MQRPTSLTVIGWILIVFGAFGLLGVLLLAGNPDAQHALEQSSLPVSAHIAIGVVGALISATCGYGVLKGLGWSRLVYVAWILVSIAITLVSMPFNSLMLIGWLIQAVIIFFLFRPAANGWFGGEAAVGE